MHKQVAGNTETFCEAVIMWSSHFICYNANMKHSCLQQSQLNCIPSTP